MSDSIKVEEKPKLEDITMEDATSSTPAAASTVSAVEEFAPQKNADGELIIKDLPEALKGKSEEEVAEVKKAIVEQGELVGSISNFYMRVLLASKRCVRHMGYATVRLNNSHLAAFLQSNSTFPTPTSHTTSSYTPSPSATRSDGSTSPSSSLSNV
jgi:hypothetical protein